MLRSATVVLAILVALGSSGLSTSALASGSIYGRGGGDGFRDNHFSGGFRNIPRDGGLGEFRGYGGRDVWGHWGAYYGPMIPTI